MAYHCKDMQLIYPKVRSTKYGVWLRYKASKIYDKY